MEKQNYEKPIIEIIEIEEHDVITTSNLGETIPGDNEVGGFFN